LKQQPIKIMIFYPSSTCVCSSQFVLEKVVKVSARFKGLVDYDIRSTDSEEAKIFSVKDPCVLVNGSVKLVLNFDEEALVDAIKICL
jgi:hypothetical protein